MHLIGTIFAVLGWILLGLLALLLIVLIMPVCVSMELREGTLSVWVRLFRVFKLKLLPLKKTAAPKQEKEKEPKPAAPAAKEEKPPEEAPAPPPKEDAAPKPKPAEAPKTEAEASKKKKFAITFDFIMEVLSAAGVLMRRVFRALHFRKIILVLPIHKDDAAQTALACGQVQAALSAGIAALENFLDLRFDGVRILPDFTDEIQAGPYVSFELATRPILLVLAGLCALWRFLMRYLDDRKMRAKTKDIQKTEEKK